MIPYTILALIALALGAYTLIVLPRDGWRRYAAPAVFGGIIAALFALTFLSLGNPRPGWLYRGWGPDVQVLAATWEEGRAIWVLVRGPEDAGPILIELSWSLQQAERLNGEMANATESGGTVELNLGAATGPEAEAAVHPKPPEAMPLKQ